MQNNDVKKKKRKLPFEPRGKCRFGPAPSQTLRTFSAPLRPTPSEHLSTYALFQHLRTFSASLRLRIFSTSLRLRILSAPLRHLIF